MAPLAPFCGNVSSTITNKSRWHQWHHWRQWCYWKNWRSIGANGNWSVPMASLTPMVSMVPLATLVIHWCKWRFIGIIGIIEVNDANGTNDSSGIIDFNVQWHVWNVEDTLPFNDAIGAYDANVADGIINHWNQCRHWRYCQHCHHCMTNVSWLCPMDRHWRQCCHCCHLSPLVPSTVIGYLNLHIAPLSPLPLAQILPLAPFLLPLAQMGPMARIPNRNDTFTKNTFDI